MILNVRGYKIQCYAKDSTKDMYYRLYAKLSDERLALLEQETAGGEPYVHIQGTDTSEEGH